MGEQWKWEQPSRSPPQGLTPSTVATLAVASLPPALILYVPQTHRAPFPWPRLHPQQQEEGTRCPRIAIKSLTAPFTPRWCKMNPTTRLQALHRIPAASTCCPELNPSLSPPRSRSSRGAQSKRIFKPYAFKTTTKEIILLWHIFKWKTAVLLCLRSDYLPGVGWESNTYFPSLSKETGQMWCPQVRLLCCGSIPSEDNVLTPSVECGKGQADCGLVFPIGSCEAPSPGTEVQLHPHRLCSQVTEPICPMDA